MKKTVILAALFMGFGGAAWADGDFEVGVEGGVMQTDPQHAGAAWGLRAGIRLAGPLRLQARYLSMGIDETVPLREFGGQMRVSLMPLELTPYAFVGIAKRWIADDGTWFVPFGGGFDIPVAPFVRLAPEMTWQHLVSTPPPLTDPALSRDGWNLSLVLHLDI